MNKNYIIGGALIVGGGLYYAYTKGLLDKFIKPKTPKDANEENQAAIDAIKQEQKAVVTEKKIVNKERQTIFKIRLIFFIKIIPTTTGINIAKAQP